MPLNDHTSGSKGVVWRLNIASSQFKWYLNLDACKYHLFHTDWTLIELVHSDFRVLKFITAILGDQFKINNWSN